MYGSNFPLPRLGRPGPMGRPMGRMEMGPPVSMMQPPMPLVDANVGSVTNDPNSSHCRVFVGNLNTHVMTKEDVERIFCNYGFITDISMHKGYAFVQYRSPADARRAAALEDGKLYAHMRIDTNVASEPKRQAKGQKRPGVAPLPTRPAQGPGPVTKKPRVDTNPSMQRTLVTISSSGTTPPKNVIKKTVPVARVVKNIAKPSVSSQQTAATKALNTSSGDILICGRCRAMFPNVHRLAMHKKVQCVVKTNCKCQSTKTTDLEPTPLTCAKCSLSFVNAWDLVQHCQAEHSLAIYKSASKTSSQKAAENNETKTVSTDSEKKSEAETKVKEEAEDLNGDDEVQLEEATEESSQEEVGGGDN